MKDFHYCIWGVINKSDHSYLQEMKFQPHITFDKNIKSVSEAMDRFQRIINKINKVPGNYKVLVETLKGYTTEEKEEEDEFFAYVYPVKIKPSFFSFRYRKYF